MTLVVSPAVLDEYQRVGRALADRYEGVELEPFLALVAVYADVVETEELSEQVCSDSDETSSTPVRWPGRACGGGG